MKKRKGVERVARLNRPKFVFTSLFCLFCGVWGHLRAMNCSYR